jgi:hypothetical protein
MTKIASVVALCALGVLGVAGAAQSQPAGKKAQLKVLDTTPLVVRGVGFKAKERVRLLASTGAETQSKTRIATQAGVVTVTFGVSAHQCRFFRVRAVGGKGTRAAVSSITGIEAAYPRMPQPDCVPVDTIDR